MSPPELDFSRLSSLRSLALFSATSYGGQGPIFRLVNMLGTLPSHNSIQSINLYFTLPHREYPTTDSWVALDTCFTRPELRAAKVTIFSHCTIYPIANVSASEFMGSAFPDFAALLPNLHSMGRLHIDDTFTC
jgi:hypothetical protein